jgi:hypothetical protein
MNWLFDAKFVETRSSPVEPLGDVPLFCSVVKLLEQGYALILDPSISFSVLRSNKQTRKLDVSQGNRMCPFHSSDYFSHKDCFDSKFVVILLRVLQLFSSLRSRIVSRGPMGQETSPSTIFEN